ncbi:DUF1987 domain-containing protein [Paraburkholderia flava]|uniref:DUF1987 domain-containing protein n=1 Tax=Paraburkholderia flava TaxID=2547393 RepID=UPI001980E265|nr:DUF1987 domain-containing protein [Paraburkholderia flava]
MTPIKLPRTDFTPQIEFSPADASLFVEGECHPENPNTFFGPILQLIGTYLQTAAPPRFLMRVRLTYINSASTKAMRQLFMVLSDASKRGCNVDIDWEFDPDDDAIQELGQDLLYGLGATTVMFNEVLIET